MNILKVIVLVIASGAALLGIELSEHTHSERWRVKTLADGFYLGDSIHSTTIREQAALPEPKVDESVTRLPSERDLYSLTARLISVKKEFDGDYHLVLEDTATHLRMIAEIPDSSSTAPVGYKNDFIMARKEIDRLIGTHPGMFAFHPVTTPMIEITGVGFFDEPHMFMPTGMAQNGREIHPVLRISPLLASDIR